MAMNIQREQDRHFLLVTAALQGLINPARQLARRLAQAADARVTIATPLSSHRRLFPKSSVAVSEPDEDTEEKFPSAGSVAYAPYSDGFDEGFHPPTQDLNSYLEKSRFVGSQTIATMAAKFEERGRPITCILYTLSLTWAADIARTFGIPSFHYWIQPASVFAVYYHYFQNHPSFASSPVILPGIPPLRKTDIPSIIFSAAHPYLAVHKDIFIELAKMEKPFVLVNTFQDLEAPVMDAFPGIKLLAIGPLMEDPATAKSCRDLFEEDACDYMGWLDAQEEKSVVYVAFGSLTRLRARQVEELKKGLRDSGRPYLWVLRKDSREELLEMEEGKGMIVEWCSQVKVLNHRAVGCFVTHGGWNSVSESLASGVPMVIFPEWLEQVTNARLAEAQWGVGVRAQALEDGLVEAEELSRGIQLVMADEMRTKALEWKEKAAAALAEGGSSSRNLIAFVNGLDKI